MKHKLAWLLVLVVFELGTSEALTQDGGTVRFSNRYLNGLVNAPFFNQKLEYLDEKYMAQIYAWNPEIGFVAVGSTTPFFSQEAKNGYFNGGYSDIHFIEPLSQVWVQVRAWFSEAGATFEDAALAGAWTGASNFVYLPITGGRGEPPYVPAPMIGLKYPGAPIIVQQPKPKTIQARSKVTLSVVASSGVEATYQWFQEPSDSP